MDRARVIAQEISKLLPKLLRGLRAGFVAAPQVTTSQMVTLMRIYEKKNTRVGILSKEMHVSAPTITGVVDRLLRSGYLRRIPDKQDRRAVNVELTDKGRRLAENLFSEINQRWYKILKNLTDEERENYLRILRRIVEVLAREYA
ncbi:MarR family winged helix-turn-helix transcriptional regulator [Candidatus Omnitrophota bacterium]